MSKLPVGATVWKLAKEISIIYKQVNNTFR